MAQPSAAVLRARESWTNRGTRRPDFAETPGPGRESVWDYPRPPRVEPERRRVRVGHGDARIADSVRARRVCETASPPTVYVPPEDVDLGALFEAEGARSLCEWKGRARSWCLAAEGPAAEPVGWDYPDPFPEFRALAGWLAFYPGRVACWLDDERVRPQPGGYYGGWVSPELVGPFKGGPGSAGW